MARTADKTVDLCFVMDCTGSMSSWIATCKEKINSTVSRVLDAHPEVTMNLAFVAYRDWCDDASGKRLETLDFTPDVDTFQRFVSSMAATGGGDYPEDVLGGLWACTEMTWSGRTRVLFHIFDAPPHGEGVFHDSPGDSLPHGHPDDKLPEEIFAKFRDKQIRYFMLKLHNVLAKVVEVFLARAAIVGYDKIEERPEVNISDVMDDVASAVLASIGVRIARRGRPAEAAHIARPRLARNHYNVYAAIDFGTHGSAYAFCTPTNPIPTSDQCWSGSSVGVKTLTDLCLNSDKRLVEGDHGFGHAALQYYLNLDPEEQAEHYFFRRFKMALYESALEDEGDRKEDVTIKRKLKAANGKKVNSDIVLQEALRFMFRHVMGQIRHLFGDVESNKVQWIVTVPAIWSQASRQTMRKAAENAGIPTDHDDQLIIVLEPECASIMARDTRRMTPGECYMLVDCGGGTVDIACHQLVNDTQVEEIYPASGGPWGGTYVDDEFLVMLREAFGDDVMNHFQAVIESEEPGLLEELVSRFNDAKCSVLPNQKRPTKIDISSTLIPILEEVFGEEDLNAKVNERLSASSYGGIEGGVKISRGQLSLSPEIWARLFDHVICPMIAHIERILRRPDLSEKLQTLIIVGGFANSAVLFDRLTKAFPDRIVYRPHEPMLAVVRGAAKFGLIPTTIASRKAPKTIGIAIRDTWREGDPEEGKFWDDETREHVIDNVFFPFVKREWDIPRDMEPVAYYFEPVSDASFVIEIYQTDEKDPRFVPERPCAKIGPLEFPDDFDRATDIRVQFDFAGRELQVKVKFGEVPEISIDVDYLSLADE